MVLIHSITLDPSTNSVIDWLYFTGQSFFRINESSLYQIKFNEKIKIEDWDVNDFTSYWYRRGIFSSLSSSNSASLQVQYLLEENQVKILQYVEDKLCEKKHLNRYFNSKTNKLLVLKKAKKLGLMVPHFVLTDQLKESDKKYIYKPINEGGHIELKDYTGNAYTELFNEENQNICYGLTFFQEFIEKKYELRIFYLDGRFFPMTIMSQKDKQTKIDFRHYNDNKPNRTVPFQLPKDIEEKLEKLMKNLDLKSGSIDMIVSKDRQYYFLEVNPVGQFGMVSYPCNYHLEKKIAEYLSYD